MICLAGTTQPLEILLFDKSASSPLLTGRTVYVSIERWSDHYYLNGASWQSGYCTNLMTERTGDASKEAVYYFNFAIPNVSGATYLWSVKYDDSPTTTFLAYYKGSIEAVTLADMWDALLASHETTDTFGWLMKKMRAALVNKRTHNRNTGDVIDYDAAGTTPVNEFETSLAGSVETRQPV